MKETKEQVIARLREADPFVEFENLDTRGLPSFWESELEAAENKTDKFEQNDYLETNKSGLRDFLKGLDSDNEAIADAARMAGADPSVIADHLDRVAQQIGIDFKKAVGKRYVQCDENLVAMV